MKKKKVVRASRPARSVSKSDDGVLFLYLGVALLLACTVYSVYVIFGSTIQVQDNYFWYLVIGFLAGISSLGLWLLGKERKGKK